MFNALGRLFRAVKYLFTGKVDAAADALSAKPTVISANYDRIIQEKSNTIQFVEDGNGTTEGFTFGDQERCTGIVECDSVAIECFQAEEVFTITSGMEIELLGPDIATRVERPVAALILRQFQLNLSGDFTGQVDLEGDDEILTRPIDRLRVVPVAHGSLAERESVAHETATHQKSQRSINIHK